MSNLFLSAKPDVRSIIERGLDHIPAGDRHVVHARVMLRDLVPLTWKAAVQFRNGNSQDVTCGAAVVLFLQNIDELARAESARWLTARDTKVQLGDFVVNLPMEHEPKHLPGKNDGFNLQVATANHLVDNAVVIFYVGKTLPADVAKVLGHLDWKTLDLVQQDDFEERARASGNKTVSVFDAFKCGFCTDGVEAFQRRYFPGRSEVKIAELIPHLGNDYVKQLVSRQLGINVSSARGYMAETEARQRHVVKLLQTMGIYEPAPQAKSSSDGDERERLHWRKLARAVGSTMADLGHTASDWQREYVRLISRR